ncbi:MAG: ArsA-related P-loop ATPase, partial [Pseudohongiella sp.]|nr:ArsA-related P-loop ATPase [Pseudohongiella sp.]
MLLELAAQRRVLFFGGKGGVGKTTVSASTALAMADSGKRVLLVSTDPAHNLGHLFDRKIGPSPVRLAPGLDGLELDPELTVEKHLEEVTAALRRIMPIHLASEIDKHMALSRDAPGMQEAAIL